MIAGPERHSGVVNWFQETKPSQRVDDLNLHSNNQRSFPTKLEFHQLSRLGNGSRQRRDQVTKGIEDAWRNQSHGTEQGQNLEGTM